MYNLFILVLDTYFFNTTDQILAFINVLMCSSSCLPYLTNTLSMKRRRAQQGFQSHATYITL